MSSFLGNHISCTCVALNEEKHKAHEERSSGSSAVWLSRVGIRVTVGHVLPRAPVGAALPCAVTPCR